MRSTVIYLSLISLLLLGVYSGCKVKYSLTGGSLPQGCETLSVERFENTAQTIFPTLTQNLTEALKDRFLRQTNLRLVAAAGDMHYSGTVVGYAVTPVAIQGNDVAAQNRLTITVKVKYENEPNPDMNWEKSFSQFLDFSSSQSLSDVEADLNNQIIDQLTLDIFNKTLDNW